MIWMTLLYKSDLMLGGLQWMLARSILLLRIIWTCVYVEIVFTMWNWGHRQPRHYLYRFSFSSSPSIRIWDQLNGVSLPDKNTHREVKQINTVGSYQIDQFNGRWNNFSHTAETRMSWNSNRKLAKEIHIWLLGFIYIDWIDRKNATHWQRRTSILTSFTKTPGIANSY